MLNKFLSILAIISFVNAQTDILQNEGLCKKTVEIIQDINGRIQKVNETEYKCCYGYSAVGTDELRENSKNCKPICDPVCPLSYKCYKPHTCIKCPAKYSTHDDCDILCDSSNLFRYNSELNQCVLENCSCSKDGYCLSSYKDCRCYEGFHLTDDNRCQPQCLVKCENADCVGPNECECWAGYHVTDKTNICESNAVCRRQLCENGECLLTGECKCKKGFIKSFTFKGQILCEKMTTFIGKIMSLILGIPLALASIALLTVYVVARRRKNQNNSAYPVSCSHDGDDGDHVIYSFN